MLFMDFIYNLGILVAFTIISGFLSESRQSRRLLTIAQGVLFGFASLIAMLNPLVLGPGLIFDGRSVMVSLTSLFFGPLAASIAAGMAVILRFYEGGIGAPTGIMVILSSALLGVLFHYKLKQKSQLTALNLWLFGLLVHIAMLLLMLTLPAGKGIIVLQKIALPVIIAYPLATILIGKILTKYDERVSLRANLQISEAKFKQLIWDMQVGVLLQGPQAEILLSNPMALEMLGLTEDQLLGKSSFDPYWNVIHEDGSPFPGNTHPVPMAIATGKSVRSVVMGVNRPLKKDRVWLLVDAEPQFNSDGTILQVVCTFNNITLRKLAEKSLRETNDYLEKLIGYANAPIIVWDNNFIITRFNGAFENLTGKKAAEVLNTSISNLFPADSRESSMNLIKETAAGIRWESAEIKIQHRDGSVKTVLWNSANIFAQDDKTIVSTIAQGNDITERKKAEEELKKQNILIYTLFENLPIGIFMVNASDGSAIIANNVAKKLLGRGIMPNATISNLQDVYQAYKVGTTEHYPVEEMPLVKAMHGEFGHIDDMEVERPDGTRVLLEIFGSPVYDTNNQIWAGLVGFLDITERKTAEMMLQQQADNLLASNQELTIFNKASIDREIRMIELKKEVNDLCKQAGLVERYSMDFLQQD